MSTSRRPPRYDLPNAAPEPVRLVQLFVNTAADETGRELLATPADATAWFAAHGLDAGALTAAELERTRAVRAALHEVIRREPGTERAHETLRAEARRARLAVDLSEGRLVPEASGVAGALGAVLAVAYDAMRDGTWARLKACRHCRWVYWDRSRNRSATWCSMQLCGSRQKARRHRARRAAGGATAGG